MTNLPKQTGFGNQKHGSSIELKKMASKVIPHFALCGGNDDCLGSREGEKKGKKRKGVNKAARRTKASETHTQTVTPPQSRRGSRPRRVESSQQQGC